jgi:hypothetical protein
MNGSDNEMEPEAERNNMFPNFDVNVGGTEGDTPPKLPPGGRGERLFSFSVLETVLFVT